MLEKHTLLAASIFSLVLSACGGGDSGNDITGNTQSGNSYSSGATVVTDASGEPPAAPDTTPWYITADPTQARFNSPHGIELDRAGNLYVADSNNYTIRKIARTGVVTTLAGAAGSPGSEDGTGNAARFTEPSDLAVDRAGNVYVTDRFVVRKITPDGTVKTIAGMQGEWGYVDATGAAARFNSLRGIAVDKESNLYVADSLNARIRKITPEGVVTTLAGGYTGSEIIVDGVGTQAGFDLPSGLTIDRHGRLYVTDIAIRAAGILRQGSTFVRRVDTRSAEVVTLAGNFGIPVEPEPGNNETVAQFTGGTGIAVDHDGNIYVADFLNNRGRLQRISPDGQISTIATVPEIGRSVYDVTVHWQGNLFVSEPIWHTIDKITPALELNTYAGKAREAGDADTP